MAEKQHPREIMPRINKTTMQVGYTLPIDLVPRFNAIASKKMLKPSHLLTTLILDFVEAQEKLNN